MAEGPGAASGGASTLGLLGVAFIVLKLCHVIAWSWWWVTAPLWGPVAIVLAVALVLAIPYLWLLVQIQRDKNARRAAIQRHEELQRRMR